MFGFFKRKEKTLPYKVVNTSKFDEFVSNGSNNRSANERGSDESTESLLVYQSSWIENSLNLVDGFSRIDWNSVVDKLVQLSPETAKKIEQSNFSNELLKNWALRLSTEISAQHAVYESEHFLIVASDSNSQLSLLIKFLEKAHRQILSILPDIAMSNEDHKLVVLLFDDSEKYYQYISHYYPKDGEFAMSGGIFIKQGFGHFALPDSEINQFESVATHELTHALLSHLSLPVWLDEGLAVNVESVVTGFSSYTLNKNKHLKHQQFWNEQTIQDFWSGDSFSQPGDASDLSYHLAQLLVKSLSQDFDSFRAFVTHASIQDAGGKAASQVFNGGLGDMVEAIYGHGNWNPNPGAWPD
ncbi:MAG: hypothetical protein KUG78_21360 [Kangiellaceae bacterium]|nr:hypothetical protein [Kangiellaceae bacterium]